jgi:hypothetical protein
MQRTTWTFQYPAGTILDATRRQAAHHREREAWWAAELEQTATDIKSHGVELAEFETSHARRLDWRVDQTLERRYRECAAKVEQHRAEAKEFDTWVRALELNPDALLGLDRDDIGYFGL